MNSIFEKLHDLLLNCSLSFNIREHTLSVQEEGGGRRKVLQIFQTKFRSQGDHRSKYFMANYFFRKILGVQKKLYLTLKLYKLTLRHAT